MSVLEFAFGWRDANNDGISDNTTSFVGGHLTINDRDGSLGPIAIKLPDGTDSGLFAQITTAANQQANYSGVIDLNGFPQPPFTAPLYQSSGATVVATITGSMTNGETISSIEFDTFNQFSNETDITIGGVRKSHASSSADNRDVVTYSGTEIPDTPIAISFDPSIGSSLAVFGQFRITTTASAPTITSINTNNEVTPGATATLTGTNLTNATGLNIGSVSQSNFTVVNDTTVTFTGTRGGNPYNQDLTATLLSPDGNATITVQQVPEAGTFAVTAASPNTTDDASLATQLIDTSTGDPVTVVDGDQVWATDYGTLSTPEIPFTINPDFTITAGNTGTFTVQFWRASEGVWGSDQTVTFEVPDNGGGTPVDPVTPGGQSIRNTVRNSARNTVRSTRRTL